MARKCWLPAASTTRCAGKRCPSTTTTTSVSSLRAGARQVCGRAVGSAPLLVPTPRVGPVLKRRRGHAFVRLHPRTKRSVCGVGGVLTYSPRATRAPLIGCGGTQGPTPFLPSQAPAPVPHPGHVNA